MRDSLNRFLVFQRGQMRKSADQVQKTVTTTGTLTVFLGALASIASALLAWLMSGWLSRQLGCEPAYAANVAREIAAGDLTVDVQLRAGDSSSVLAAMRHMRDSLADVVAVVRQGSEAVASVSVQIARGNMDLSARTESQAGSVEETAASMEELGSTVRQNADNARQANQLAVLASEVAAKGGEVVSRAVQMMGSINASSKKIEDITGVIESIAFQTNILALNAAVEAARAGEQGRGFAVVAEEVRALAQRSAAAVKDIKSLIDDSVETVSQGSELVGQAGITMAEIVESTKRVTDIMGEITAATREQSSGIEQVTQAIAQIDKVTQQNAVLVEEAAAAARSMQEQAAGLTQAVSVFKLGNGSRSGIADNGAHIAP
ncbi:methyl-accepting chemotaxis protein [Paraburkholderia phenoliruptrix]|nr:methyl-accepting chemotaxis protein [Paraburkholderia phenoliruptrix]MBW9128129.1 methyl-accepting chemotaxis protein [Paraburkholderia ginsengiterrae]